jgi:hypothetical protein
MRDLPKECEMSLISWGGKVKPAELQEVKKPRWDPNWDEATAEVAYQEALRIQDIQSQWSDAIDTKVAGIFAVASVIVTISPALGVPHGGSTATALWGAAAACWLLASVFCYLAFRPRGLEIGPNPSGLLHRRWMQLTVHEFRLYRMSDMGESYALNKNTLDSKASWLAWATYLTFAEVFALLLAFSCSQP